MQQADIPLPHEGQESADSPAVSGREYEISTGETLKRTLDLSTWHPGADLAEMYERLRQEVAEAVKQETVIQKQIRDVIFPKLRTMPGAPSCAGVYQATENQLGDVHRKLLFNGGVEACDGTVVSHDTLPVTITQIGVCLVSYRGDQGSWVHRVFRRDLRSTGKNPLEETIDLIEKRQHRSAIDYQSQRDVLSSLARRGIMAYAERAVLLEKSNSVWLMGQGSPAPYELVTGSGMKELCYESLKLMSRLILEHKKFVYIPSAPTARALLTIGNALKPLQYAIVDTYADNLKRIADGHYRGEGWGDLSSAVRKFAKDCGSKIVVGMYKASEIAPCHMFYAHVDHAHEAALIAMADAVLQEHRGFPMLLDLADGLCTATFGADAFNASAQLAYAEANAPFKYMAERKTRNR